MTGPATPEPGQDITSTAKLQLLFARKNVGRH